MERDGAGRMYGAAIERGKILSVESGGYRIESYTRDGITTPPIPAMGGAAYSAGDRVYFFLFDDGSGAILAAFGG